MAPFLTFAWIPGMMKVEIFRRSKRWVFAHRSVLLAATVAAVAAMSPPTLAQQDATEKSIERYRQMLSDPFANPGTLVADRGEILWAKPRGPRNAAMTACDLGLGAGVTNGAFVAMPRYFADADRVMDLEARLLWCMTTLQGFDPAEVTKTKFSSPGVDSDLEALTAYVAVQSAGMAFAAKLDHPREKQAYALGEALFFRRQGPMDFACATCHGEDGKRIRLQPLPQFDNPAQAREVIGTWPAYRVSQDALRTMQHRLYDCFWQMRLPPVEYGSDVTVALIMYLAQKGAGGIVAVPSIKR